MWLPRPGESLRREQEGERAQAGIQEPPYTLRHSYASLRMREGLSIPEIAEDLGHSQIMTLETNLVCHRCVTEGEGRG